MDMLFGTLAAVGLAVLLHTMLTFPRSAYARMLRALATTGAMPTEKAAASESALGEKLRLIPLTRSLTAEQFILLQSAPALLLVLVLIVTAVVARRQPNWQLTALAPPVVWLLPRLWLNSMVWQRQQSISRGYSDLVAHLVLMLEAGASVQQAFSTAVAVTREPLRSELVQLVADLKLSPLPSALQRFADRTGHRQIKFFAENLMLQQRIGIGLADALREEERHTRILQQEAARQRIKAGAVTMAAVTAVLLANGLIVMALPVAGQWLSVMGGRLGP